VQREIQRRNQEYERMISFEFRGPGRVGNRYLKSFLEGTEVPPGYTLEESRGVFLTSREEQQIYLALLLALLLIFMVSAALFESLVLPFVAILSVPLSFVGVALAFWLADESFDRTAYIGLILLAGIAINNALLLVHRAGALHRKTRRVMESARRAAVERFRPILLTTVTSVAGLAPLIWGVDPEGAASWRTLAIAATAGLLTSAVCTLLVVPPLFSLFVGRGRTPAALPVDPLSAGDRGMS
jgi:HAE1 family hydrophobic/amphiphilic exporter-1